MQRYTYVYPNDTKAGSPTHLCVVCCIRVTNTQTEIHGQILPRGWSPGHCVIRLCLQPSLDLNYHPSLGACTHLSSSRNPGESEGGMSSPLSHNIISSEQNTPTQSNVQLEFITLMIQHAVGCFFSGQWGLLGPTSPGTLGFS